MEKTKKVARILVYSFFLFSLFTALSASSAQAVSFPFYVPNPFTGNVTLESVIVTIINIAFLAAGLVAVIYLIIGGFRYVTSGGNAEAIEGAKATILNAIIGLIVIFISFLLVNYILRSLGISSIFNPQPTRTSGGGGGINV